MEIVIHAVTASLNDPERLVRSADLSVRNIRKSTRLVRAVVRQLVRKLVDASRRARTDMDWVARPLRTPGMLEAVRL